MSEITRFFSWDGNEFMHEATNGDYVLYEDHIAQVERLTAERHQLQGDVEELTAERDEARAEVERLRANGQGMLDTSRPSDEDIWRKGYKRQVDEYRKQWGPR